MARLAKYRGFPAGDRFEIRSLPRPPSPCRLGRTVGRSGTVAPPNGRTLDGTWVRRRGRALQRAGRRVERHMERAAR